MIMLIVTVKTQGFLALWKWLISPVLCCVCVTITCVKCVNEDSFFFGVGIIQFGLFNSANYFHAQKICNTLEGRRKHNRGTLILALATLNIWLWLKWVVRICLVKAPEKSHISICNSNFKKFTSWKLEILKTPIWLQQLLHCSNTLSPLLRLGLLDWLLHIQSLFFPLFFAVLDLSLALILDNLEILCSAVIQICTVRWLGCFQQKPFSLVTAVNFKLSRVGLCKFRMPFNSSQTTCIWLVSSDKISKETSLIIQVYIDY